jgi:hypothetical protein
MADLIPGLPHPILLTSECSSYTDRNHYHYDYGNSDQSRNQQGNQKQQQNRSSRQGNQKQSRNEKQSRDEKQQRSRYLGGSGSGGDWFHDQSATQVPFYLTWSSWLGGSQVVRSPLR